MRVGVNQSHIANLDTVQDSLCCQGNRNVVHRGVYPVGREGGPREIKPDVMSPTGYVRRTILFRERFNLWDYPQDL